VSRFWWWLRLKAKDFWCYSGYGSMLIEYCEDCGIRMPLVWWSSNDLWLEMTGHATEPGNNAGGILCPECFARRAEKRGIVLQWHPTVACRKRPPAPVSAPATEEARDA
jgi:hypothetical protein